MNEELSVMFPLAAIRRVLLIGALVCLGLGAIAGIGAVVIPDPPDWALRTGGTAALGGGAGLVSMICLVAFTSANRLVVPRIAAAVALVAVAIGTVTSVGLIWEFDIVRRAEWPEVVLPACFITAGGVAIGSLALVQDLPGRWAWARTIALAITYTTTAFTAASFAFSDMFEDQFGYDFLPRVLAAAWILTAFSATCTPIVSRLATAERRRIEALGRKSTGFADAHVKLVCPNCAAQVVVPQGESACPRCNLGFSITLNELVCACGYDLLGLTGQPCPECGSTDNAGRARAARLIAPSSDAPPTDDA